MGIFAGLLLPGFQEASAAMQTSGGSDYNSAVTLISGTYQLDHHLGPNQYDYFKVYLPASGGLVIKTETQAKSVCYDSQTGIFTEVEATENIKLISCPRMAMAIVQNPDHSELREIWSYIESYEIDTYSVNSGVPYVYILFGPRNSSGFSQHKDAFLIIDTVIPSVSPTPTPTPTPPSILEQAGGVQTGSAIATLPLIFASLSGGIYGFWLVYKKKVI